MTETKDITVKVVTTYAKDFLIRVPANLPDEEAEKKAIDHIKAMFSNADIVVNAPKDLVDVEFSINPDGSSRREDCGAIEVEDD